MKKLALVLMLALAFGATYQGAKTKKLASFEDQLLDAYDAIFNDLEAVNRGQFGMSRVPHNPRDHHSRLAVRDNTYHSDWDASQTAFANARDAIGLESYLEHGVLAAPGTVFRSPSGSEYSPFALWLNHNGDKSHQLFGNSSRSVAPSDTMSKFAGDIRAKVAADPKARITLNMDGWVIKARAVFFRHKECVECHKNAKVGDVAAIVAVATKRKL